MYTYITRTRVFKVWILCGLFRYIAVIIGSYTASKCVLTADDDLKISEERSPSITECATTESACGGE